MRDVDLEIRTPQGAPPSCWGSKGGGPEGRAVGGSLEGSKGGRAVGGSLEGSKGGGPEGRVEDGGPEGRAEGGGPEGRAVDGSLEEDGAEDRERYKAGGSAEGSDRTATVRQAGRTTALGRTALRGQRGR